MRYAAAAIALLWVFVTVASFALGKDWVIPSGAALGWGMVAFAEWQIVSLRNTVKQLASGGAA